MATPFEIGACGLIPLLAGLLLSFLIEQFLHPRPHLRTRSAAAFALHMGLWLLLFGVGLAISQRPYFASGLNTAGMLLIVLVSNAKFASLREPFLLSDFRFFKALLRHPRLYLPFFGVLPAIGCAVVFVAFCIFALRIEPSLLSQFGTVPFVFICLISMSIGAALLWIGTRKPIPITLDPVRDLHQFGLLGSFILYWQEELANDPRALAKNLTSTIDALSQIESVQNLPHIVAVQCESFFDARRVYQGIHADVLNNFDALNKLSGRAGRLNVPAWGANTVRTEFSFLAGVSPSSTGVHQFNPYRKLARHGVPTIASELKKQGYRTICVHPFPATFYDRDVVFPALGFDEFIDLAAFSPDQKSGPYIGDAAVADKVRTILGTATEPLFIFVITMENHGPLHQEQVEAGDVARLYAGVPPPGYEEFTIYLRHLQHTDAMLGGLHDALQATPRAGWLCAYGDHVPILSSLYKLNDFADGRTDYFIVGCNVEAINATAVDIAPEELARSLLQAAGFYR